MADIKIYDEFLEGIELGKYLNDFLIQVAEMHSRPLQYDIVTIDEGKGIEDTNFELDDIVTISNEVESEELSNSITEVLTKIHNNREIIKESLISKLSESKANKKIEYLEKISKVVESGKITKGNDITFLSFDDLDEIQMINQDNCFVDASEDIGMKVSFSRNGLSSKIQLWLNISEETIDNGFKNSSEEQKKVIANELEFKSKLSNFYDKVSKNIDENIQFEITEEGYVEQFDFSISLKDLFQGTRNFDSKTDEAERIVKFLRPINDMYLTLPSGDQLLVSPIKDIKVSINEGVVSFSLEDGINKRIQNDKDLHLSLVTYAKELNLSNITENNIKNDLGR